MKVSDWMQDYQLLDGVIVVRDVNGNTVHTISGDELKWTNDTTYADSQLALLEYTFPADSNNGPYTITYTTKVPVDVGRDGWVTISNSVQTDDGGSDSTGVPVDFSTRPGPGASVDKSFVDWKGKDPDGVANGGIITNKQDSTKDISIKKNWPEGQTVPDGTYVVFTLKGTVPGATQSDDPVEVDLVTLSISPLEVTLDGVVDTVGDIYETTPWEYTWNGLPKYDGTSNEITYTVTETEYKIGEVDYSTLVANAADETATEGYDFSFTNQLPTTERYATKIWAGTEGSNVTFTLSGNYDNAGTATSVNLETEYGVSNPTVTLVKDSETGKWPTAKWENLPMYTKTGKFITYSVTEAPVEGYRTELVYDDTTKTWTITNTELKDISIYKTWNGVATNDDPKISSITYTLTKSLTGVDKKETETVTIARTKVGDNYTYTVSVDGNAAVEDPNRTGWDYIWNDLDAYGRIKTASAGDPIGDVGSGDSQGTYTEDQYSEAGTFIYSVEETEFVYDGVRYYVSGNATDGYTVTADDTTVDEGEVAHTYWKTTRDDYAFTNTLDETTFTAIKLWEENFITEVWPANTSITLELTRKKQASDTENDTTICTGGKYELVIGKADSGEPSITSVTPVFPQGVSATIVAVDNDGSKGYTISIVGLEKTWKDTTTSGDYVYFLNETSSAGFNPSYWETVDDGQGGTTQQEIKGASAAKNGQIIKNTKYSVSLPSTGGPGTTGFYVIGTILTLLALVLLFTKKRSDGAGIE